MVALGLGAVLSTALLTACSSASSATSTDTSTASSQKGTLTLAINAALGSWDPKALIDASDSDIWWHAAYGTLLTCNAKGEPGPGLAKSFSLSKDAKTLTLTLRSGMTFQDGTAIDADAVKSSIEHMQNGGAEASRVAGVTVNVVNDHTVQLVSPAANALMPTNMCMAAGIISSPKALASPTTLAAAPVSSGPYTLDVAATTAGSVYTFKKRSDFWDASAYPYKTIVMRQMTDGTARLNALKSGQVDFSAIDPTSVSQAQGPGIDILKGSSRIYTLNIADRAGAVAPALANAKVREAINMVFDRQAILKGLLGGGSLGAAAQQMFLPTSSAYKSSIKIPYDIAGAKKLMSEAGYASGFDIQIPAAPDITATVNPMVVQQLATIGIKATQVSLTDAAYTTQAESGKFPIFFLPMGVTANPLYSIGTFVAPQSPWNVNKSTTPQLATQIAAAQTLTGTAATKNFQAINQTLTNEGWFAPLAYVNAYYGAKNGVLPKSTSMYPPTPSLSDFK
jgi:peptide/nickel transport system substrate-binding protein